MRYILFIIAFLPLIANSQVVTQPGLRDYQVSGANLPDSVLYILGTDTLDGSAKQGLGKFLTAESLRGFFKDTDWLKYRTGTIPNNTDTMYHVGVATVGEDSVYTGTNILTGKLNVVGRLDLRFGEVQDYNIMIGRDAGRSAMTGAANIGIGSQSLDAITTGSNNIGIGSGTGSAITTGARNFAMGPNALLLNVTGSDNIAVGNSALNAYTGSRSIGIGVSSLALSETGNDNVSIGYQSGSNLLSSGFNTIVGNQAGFTTDGASNVFIGYQSGRLNEGSSNIFIGKESGENETGSELLYIDPTNTTTPLIKGDFAADTLRINGDLSIRDAVSGASTDSVLVWTPSNGRVKMRDAATFGGSGATDLSISQSGGTQVIQSSTGTDVGVRNLYGLLITEGVTDTLHFRVDSSLFATTYDLTQIPISSLKAATKINTIDNTTYKQEWKWDGIAGTDGLKLSSITTAAASDLQKLLNVSLSGTNGTSGQDTWAGYFSNTHAGTTSTNYGVYSTASGGLSANYALYGEANGANGQGVTGTSSGNIGVLGIGAIGVYGSATSGAGVYSTATSGIAVSANATSGTGVEAIVTSGIPISVQDNSAGTNTVEPMIQMYHLTTGTAAAGIGSSIVYNTEANDGSDYVSTTLTSKWTTATAGSRVSNFVVSGVNAAVEADLLTVKGSGQIQLNKYTGGAFSGTAVYNVLIDASGNLIVGSVPVGTNNITEENNSVVQSGTLTYDFQNPFDVTTDGGTEVNISFDGGEFTTVTSIESDDYMLMHDSGTPANQKILWTDVLIDLIAFEDGNSSVGTGNTIDVGEGLDIDMSPSTEANINLDASEFQIDGTAEGTEYVLIHDTDTTAGHQIQRRLVSSFGGADGDGIYDGSGTVPTTTVATLTDNLTFNTGASEADLFIDGTNDLIGIGTNSPEQQLTISNEDSNISYPIMAFHTDQTGSGTAVIGTTNYLYGAEALAAVSTQKKTSTGSNDAVYMIDMMDSGGAAENALDITIKDAYAKNRPRLNLYGAMQHSSVDSIGANTTLDESYFAVRCTTSTITITLPNANTTNNEWIGTQYWIYNNSGGNITIDPNGTNDTVNGSNANITVADHAGYYLMLMSTTAGAVNNWMALKTP